MVTRRVVKKKRIKPRTTVVKKGQNDKVKRLLIVGGVLLGVYFVSKSMASMPSSDVDPGGDDPVVEPIPDPTTEVPLLEGESFSSYDDTNAFHFGDQGSAWGELYADVAMGISSKNRFKIVATNSNVDNGALSVMIFTGLAHKSLPLINPIGVAGMASGVANYPAASEITCVMPTTDLKTVRIVASSSTGAKGWDHLICPFSHGITPPAPGVDDPTWSVIGEIEDATLHADSDWHASRHYIGCWRVNDDGDNRRYILITRIGFMPPNMGCRPFIGFENGKREHTYDRVTMMSNVQYRFLTGFSKYRVIDGHAPVTHVGVEYYSDWGAFTYFFPVVGPSEP